MSLMYSLLHHAWWESSSCFINSLPYRTAPCLPAGVEGHLCPPSGHTLKSKHRAHLYPTPSGPRLIVHAVLNSLPHHAAACARLLQCGRMRIRLQAARSHAVCDRRAGRGRRLGHLHAHGFTVSWPPGPVNPMGELPRSMQLVVDHTLVGTIAPGTRVTAVGIYSIYQARCRRRSHLHADGFAVPWPPGPAGSAVTGRCCRTWPPAYGWVYGVMAYPAGQLSKALGAAADSATRMRMGLCMGLQNPWSILPKCSCSMIWLGWTHCGGLTRA